MIYMNKVDLPLYIYGTWMKNDENRGEMVGISMVRLGFPTEDRSAFTGGAAAGDTCRLLLSSSARSRASAPLISRFCSAVKTARQALEEPRGVRCGEFHILFLFGAAKNQDFIGQITERWVN